MAKRIVRAIGWSVAAVAGLIIVALGAVYVVSSRRLAEQYAVTPTPLAIPTDSASIERGRHLAESRLGCADCHGPDLGGKAVVEDAMFGHFIAPNLTRGAGGIGATYTDADWVRSVRHGIRPNGRPLVFMPSGEFSRLSEEDLGDVLAYVKQAPPVERELPSTRPGPIGRALVTFEPSMVPARVIDHSAAFSEAPAQAATVEYGGYLAATGGCKGCHGPALDGVGGGGEPGSRPSDLTPSGPTASWSEADFRNTLRTGTRPDGTTLGDEMPWRTMGKMTDEELGAIFRYLRSLPGRAATRAKA